MNDEENRTSNQTDSIPPCPQECDSLSPPLPCEDPDAGAGDSGGDDNPRLRDLCDNGGDLSDRGKDLSGEAISDDPLQNADSPAATDPPGTAQADPSEQLAELRSELNTLRAEIAARDAQISRFGAEYAEFRALYPTVSASTLDDSVMEDVRRGIPLAAAYALAERRRLLAEERAAVSNAENSRRSSGAISATNEDYFTPDEVRKMSRPEVRANYSKILASMRKWH